MFIGHILQCKHELYSGIYHEYQFYHMVKYKEIDNFHTSSYHALLKNDATIMPKEKIYIMSCNYPDNHRAHFRNSVAKSIILSHNNYINNIIGSNHVKNPKCFWSYAKLK